MDEAQSTPLGAPPIIEMETLGQNGVLSPRKRSNEARPRLLEEA